MRKSEGCCQDWKMVDGVGCSLKFGLAMMTRMGLKEKKTEV